MTATVRRAARNDLAAVRHEVEGSCAADGHGVDAATVEHDPGLMLGLVDPSDGDAAVTWGSSIDIGGFEVVLDWTSKELR